jgi:hypothetical protein
MNKYVFQPKLESASLYSPHTTPSTESGLNPLPKFATKFHENPRLRWITRFICHDAQASLWLILLCCRISEYTFVPGGKVNILKVIVSVILRKRFIWTCVLFRTVSDIWRSVFSFFPSLWTTTTSNWRFTPIHILQTASDNRALQWEGRKILRAEFKILPRQISENVRNRTHVHINFFS